jgi:methylmalonyl-CoA/ethylmalonyl-CoA epimerase
VTTVTTEPRVDRYRLHHVGIVVPKLERVVQQYAEAFELQETSLPFDDMAQRVRVAFVRVGEDTWLEFIEPATPDCPVTQFLTKTRGGYHHVAYEVADIDAAVREFEASRAVVVCRPVVGFEGRRVAFLFPSLQPNLLTEFVEHCPADVRGDVSPSSGGYYSGSPIGLGRRAIAKWLFHREGGANQCQRRHR